MNEKDLTVVIKKIKKSNHEGHHGGSWKVAYADFVTAMMAFFLMMWLLNATSEQQRRGISNYFGPVGEGIGAGGTGGLLGGSALETKGNFNSTKPDSNVNTNHLKNEMTADEDEDEEDGNKDFLGDEPSNSKMQMKAENQKKEDIKPQELVKAQAIVQKYESQIFTQATHELLQAIQEIPELKELAENLIIDQTPEGLRIQIVDQQRYSMFPRGSFEMYPHTKTLVALVAKVIKKLPNKISITGHTDSFQFSNDKKYSNWELSADRANATRREFLDQGIPQDRMIYVVGKADTEPLVPQDKADDKNRRISIILHRTDKDNPSSPLLDSSKKTI